MMGRKDKKGEAERILDVDASMQGSLVFKDPVNLKINGSFEGKLNTKGNLMIGEHAVVNAEITGESIIIAGKVTGTINAAKDMKLIAPACVIGNIKTPLLSVAEGAILEGNVKMLSKARSDEARALNSMTINELAAYLELEETLVAEWASQGRLPATKEGNSWRFERSKIDEWVAAERTK